MCVCVCVLPVRAKAILMCVCAQENTNQTRISQLYSIESDLFFLVPFSVDFSMVR